MRVLSVRVCDDLFSQVFALAVEACANLLLVRVLFVTICDDLLNSQVIVLAVEACANLLLVKFACYSSVLVAYTTY